MPAANCKVNENKGGYGTVRANPQHVRECTLMCSPKRKGAGVPSAGVLAPGLCQGGEMRVARVPHLFYNKHRFLSLRAPNVILAILEAGL